jgi:hypothetical protein
MPAVHDLAGAFCAVVIKHRGDQMPVGVVLAAGSVRPQGQCWRCCSPALLPPLEPAEAFDIIQQTHQDGRRHGICDID